MASTQLAPLDLLADERDSFVPAGMSSPSNLGPAEFEAVNEVLTTGRLSLGPKLQEFEERLASYVGACFCTGVNSGTSALHLGVIGAGVGENDLGITSPFSFIASSNCLLFERGLPLFVDVDPVTGNIDPTLVCEAVLELQRDTPASRALLPPAARNGDTRGLAERLKVIIPIHVFGVPADMDPILEVSRPHNITVMEDACEAIGAEYKGEPVESLGDSGVFGFYPNKQMTTGEGGGIATDSERWDALFRSLRNQGRDVFDANLRHDRLGYNYRLDELSAALGAAQLTRMDELLADRARVASWYDERLHDLDGVGTPFTPSYVTRNSWFVYTVQLTAPLQRGEVMEKLAEQQVPSRPYFPPIHLQPLYRERFGFEAGAFPVAERLGETTLALPFSGVMTEAQVDYVCDRLRKIRATL